MMTNLILPVISVIEYFIVSAYNMYNVIAKLDKLLKIKR